MKSIGYPITPEGWRAIGNAVSWSGGYLFPFGDHGAVFSYRRTQGPRVAAPGENQYLDTYVLVDNGGEINVVGVGFCLDLPSVSVNGLRGALENCGPETAAYRVACILEGHPVNYEWDVDRELS